ncbi:MAG TPA: DUF58 domain-containing protein [Candidatus Dormibacteraeota bacterium]|nr:DUF58 domain-containing protein [Candidatus Dormibacteraeota bacterium]
MFGAGVLWLVLEWYGAASEVPWLFLLAAWILVLLVAAAAYAWWNRAGLRLHLAVHSSRPAAGSPAEELPEYVLRRAPHAVPVFEGDGIEAEIGLDSGGGSRGPAWVKGDLGGQQVAFGTGLVPRQGWHRLRMLRELRRGPIGATGWTVGTSDPLGFFQGSRSCDDAEVALVLPRFTSLSTRPQAREAEASVAAPRAGSGNELFGVREYRPGDSLRRIHWRSSARHGKLVVREYEPPGVRRLTIHVDAAPPSDEIADQIARIAASEAWDCIRDGGWVTLDSARPTRDIWTVLETLARYPSSSDPSDHFPASGLELVVVTAGAEFPEHADRVWVVGDAEVDPDLAFERVGTQWPL